MRAEMRAAASKWLTRLSSGPEEWSGALTASRASERILAFSPPAYLGVTQSTRRFFPDWFGLAEEQLLLAGDRQAFSDAIVEADPSAIVFSGYANGYADVIERIHRERPSTPVFVLWHASPLQLAEPEERRHFDSILELSRRGVVTRVGCFKAGEGAALTRMGAAAADVFNLPLPQDPVATDSRGGVGLGEEIDSPRVGIFSAGPSWRKNPYAMIAAVGRLPGGIVSGLLDAEASRYATELGLRLGEVRATPFDRPSLERVSSSQHVNLYVGLSECSPLFPLESLHWGVPCLFGATSHLFAGTPLCGEPHNEKARTAAQTLEAQLIVSRMDDADAIAKALTEAIAHREAILEAYADWLPAYREAAWASMESLLGRRITREDTR